MVPNDVLVDIYESSPRIGGRVRTIKTPFDDTTGYEAGGSIIHSRNKHASDLIQELGLKKKERKEKRLTGVFNGKEFVFEESSNSFITAITLFFRYGMSLFKMKSLINTMLDSFQLIYFHQDNLSASFDTLEQLLTSMSPSFVNLTKYSLRNHLVKDIHLNEELINELINSITLVNYGQTVDTLHSFVGSVAMAGAGGDLWNIEGGNELLPTRLVNASDANLFLNNAIKKIELIKDGLIKDEAIKDGLIKNEAISHSRKLTGQKFKLTDVNNNEQVYDSVIISHPLVSSSVEFVGFDTLDKGRIESERKRSKYHMTVATFVHGTRSNYLRGSNGQIEDVIICDGNFFIQSVAKLSPVGSSIKNGQQEFVYKLFSRKPLTEEQLDKLFDTITWKEHIHWYAYPEYDLNVFQNGGYLDNLHSERGPRFKLSNGFFYTNAIELAASAIEMSLISGKNAALLVAHYLGN